MWILDVGVNFSDFLDVDLDEEFTSTSKIQKKFDESDCS